MPATYTLIASNTLSSSAASVTFSAIPGTYTDLVLRCSVRNSFSGTIQNMRLRLNGLSTTVYSETWLQGDGAAASSSRLSTRAQIIEGFVVNADTSTSNSFSSIEVYIPSYTASQNKPISAITAMETNATTAYTTADAALFRDTGAITSIELTANTYNFVSGSSFFLYGIKNS